MISHMGGCQNDGPLLGTLNIRCRIIVGIQKGAIILTTTHICSRTALHKATLCLMVIRAMSSKA